MGLGFIFLLSVPPPFSSSPFPPRRGAGLAAPVRRERAAAPGGAAAAPPAAPGLLPARPPPAARGGRQLPAAGERRELRRGRPGRPPRGTPSPPSGRRCGKPPGIASSAPWCRRTSASHRGRTWHVFPDGAGAGTAPRPPPLLPAEPAFRSPRRAAGVCGAFSERCCVAGEPGGPGPGWRSAAELGKGGRAEAPAAPPGAAGTPPRPSAPAAEGRGGGGEGGAGANLRCPSPKNSGVCPRQGLPVEQDRRRGAGRRSSRGAAPPGGGRCGRPARVTGRPLALPSCPWPYRLPRPSFGVGRGGFIHQAARAPAAALARALRRVGQHGNPRMKTICCRNRHFLRLCLSAEGAAAADFSVCLRVFKPPSAGG